VDGIRARVAASHPLGEGDIGLCCSSPLLMHSFCMQQQVDRRASLAAVANSC
jgi:hypothetical protein